MKRLGISIGDGMGVLQLMRSASSRTRLLPSLRRPTGRSCGGDQSAELVIVETDQRDIMRHFAAGIADRGDRSWRQLVPQQQHGSRKAEKHVTWEKSCLCTMLSAPTNARWARNSWRFDAM